MEFKQEQLHGFQIRLTKNNCKELEALKENADALIDTLTKEYHAIL